MTGELPRPVRVFTPADLTPGDPTPGMHREIAFELPLLWAGQVVTEPGAVSGWSIMSAPLMLMLPGKTSVVVGAGSVGV